MASDHAGNKLESGVAVFAKVNEDVSIKPTTKLIGLTKEELEKYRNDPLWKTIRYVIFALFWLVWILMFVGAILIVVLSPKCAGIKCENNAVIYQIFTPTFADSDNNGIGDFGGIAAKLSLLQTMNVKGISPSPIFQTQSDSFEFLPEAVTNIDEYDERLGGKNKLLKLITEGHGLQMSLIFDVPLVVSSNTKQNTWVTGVPAGPSSIVLNLNNADVFNKLHDVAISLLKLGADGLRFTDYGLANKANAFPELNELIKKIKANATKNDDIKQKNIAFFVVSKWGIEITEANYVEAKLLEDSKNGISSMNKVISQGLELIKANKTQQLSYKFSDLNSPRIDKLTSEESAANQKNAAVVLQFIQLMLPGPANVYYGDELGLLSDSANKVPQRGLMRWSSKNPYFGFTTNDTANVFPIGTANPDSLAYNDELKNENSQLNVLKIVANLRKKEPFISGLLETASEHSIYYYSRFVKDQADEKASIYVLAVHWPAVKTAAESKVVKVPIKLLNNQNIDKAKVAAQWIQGTKLGSSIDFNKQEVKLAPYEAVIFKFD